MRQEKAPTLLDRVAGRAMWVPGLTWLALGSTSLLALQKLVPADRIDWLSRIYTRGQVLAAGARIRYVVDPRVDPARQYAFCQNHVSLIDHCTVYGATPHFKQGIELASHFEIPFYGPFMKSRGTIPVRKDGSRKEAIRDLKQRMRDEVERGHSLLVFPEGTRTLDGRVGTFHAGVLRVAHSLGLPLVPVAVTGMFEVMAKGSPYIFPGGNVTVYVDAPVETKGVARAELPALVERLRDTVRARVDAYYDGESAPPAPDGPRAVEGRPTTG